MKKLMIVASLMAAGAALNAQGRSDYETVQSDKAGEVIYKGSCTFADLEKVPGFDLLHRAQTYKADTRKITALTTTLKDDELIVFLGTWCEDSHRLIPELLRVLQDTGYPLEAVQMYALDRAKTGKDGEEKEYNITNVPTIIVLRDGEEIGRITETVHKSIESDLLRILEKE